MKINSFLEEGMPFERAINHLRRTHFPPSYEPYHWKTGKKVTFTTKCLDSCRKLLLNFPKLCIEIWYTVVGLVQFLFSHYCSELCDKLNVSVFIFT